MKISFNSTIFSQEKTGGISRYFIWLMKGLIENNINIEIVSFLHKNIFLKSFPKKIQLDIIYLIIHLLSLLRN